MQKKCILLYHSPGFKSIDEIKTYDKNYHTLEGDIIGMKEAFLRKNKGETVIFPKSTVRYNFFVTPTKNEWTITAGRPLDKPPIHCPIRRINEMSISVCFVGDFDNNNPPNEMLSAGGVLVKGLLLSENIPVERVLPERYFNKKDTHPGVKFNVKRFIKEYVL